MTMMAPFNATESMRPTSGLLPIITMARAPAAWALVRPNISQNCARLPGLNKCMSQAAAILLTVATTTITSTNQSVVKPLPSTLMSIIMPTPMRK